MAASYYPHDHKGLIKCPRVAKHYILRQPPRQLCEAVLGLEMGRGLCPVCRCLRQGQEPHSLFVMHGGEGGKEVL